MKRILILLLALGLLATAGCGAEESRKSVNNSTDDKTSVEDTNESDLWKEKVHPELLEAMDSMEGEETVNVLFVLEAPYTKEELLAQLGDEGLDRNRAFANLEDEYNNQWVDDFFHDTANTEGREYENCTDFSAPVGRIQATKDEIISYAKNNDVTRLALYPELTPFSENVTVDGWKNKLREGLFDRIDTLGENDIIEISLKLVSPIKTDEVMDMVYTDLPYDYTEVFVSNPQYLNNLDKRFHRELMDRLRVEYGDLFISTYMNDIPCYNLAPDISDIRISLNAKKSDIEYYAKLDAVESIYEVLEDEVDD